jgi:hypothetical protein
MRFDGWLWLGAIFPTQSLRPIFLSRCIWFAHWRFNPHSLPGISTQWSGAAAGGVVDGGHEQNEQADYAELDQEYQMEMMTSLREVNIDNNRVGWYQSMFLGTFNNFKLIQNLASYQEAIPNSVVLLYDPVQVKNGVWAVGV